MKKKLTKKELKINVLRTFFTISNTAFGIANLINALLSNQPRLISRMQVLHNLAFAELQKKNPDLKIIDEYLKNMELLAEENKKLNQTKP
ncbi:MAG: hypothetical protein WC886_08785 [Saccharofermentanaceae bacterium]|jgi:hypothetical protein